MKLVNWNFYTNKFIYVRNPANAYHETVALKQMMGKTDKRLWYHFVQSFPPYDNITPKLALEIALKTTEYWKDEYQILVAVHTDNLHEHQREMYRELLMTGKLAEHCKAIANEIVLAEQCSFDVV